MPEALTKFISYLMLGAAALAAVHFSWQEPEMTQPVSFPHDKHVGLNVGCVACHTGAMDETRARVPSTDACKLCHRVERSFPATPPQLASFIASAQQIPWNQAQKMPDHVYFSHRRHVGLGKIACAQCHGDIGSSQQPITRAYLRTGEAGMAQCIDCHRKTGASKDCLACHR